MTVDAQLDDRTLHEIYLPAFEASVKQGGTGSVMCSYNKVNGPWACENPTLLTAILKKELGFDGFVMSDWGGTHSTAPAVNAHRRALISVVPAYFWSVAASSPPKRHPKSAARNGSQEKPAIVLRSQCRSFAR